MQSYNLMLYGEQMGDPESTYDPILTYCFQMKWTDAKFVIQASCMSVKEASFLICCYDFLQYWNLRPTSDQNQIL